MSYSDRITAAFQNAPVLPLDASSKIVFMSDCHRGIGNGNDNFLKNEMIFISALQTYYSNGYTYIELGDGEELWENRHSETIQHVHDTVYCILDKFQKSNRLYLLYGNHDYEKSFCTDFPKKILRKSHSPDPCVNQTFSYYEGILLQDCLTHKKLYLTHGHQADLLNSTLWRLARFLVRYIWKPLELFGVADPTSAGVNYSLKEKTEKRLNHWAKSNDAVLITGHTHRAMTGNRNAPYFNSGCCIYPGSITALELTARTFTLVKWFISVKKDHTLYTAREVLSAPVRLDDLL